MENQESHKFLRFHCVLAPLLFLAALATYYCHRHYGVVLPLEGDTLQNIYFRLHEGLLRADHNPFHWDYASFLPFSGIHNPVLRLVSAGLALFAPHLEGVGRALIANMLSGWLLLVLLSWSFYFFFRQYFSRGASTLGAIIVTYTGFHLIGVWEFDLFYLCSFLFVPPMLIAFSKIGEGINRPLWAAIAALSIGLSLLGGTNAPMFYYLPLAFLIPLFQYRQHRNRRQALLAVAWYFGSCGIAFLVAAQVLVPGMVFLGETNRGSLRFALDVPLLSVFGKISTLFLRDWWRTSGISHHEVDYFLGLPVLVLLGAGVVALWRQRKEVFKDPLVLYLCFCFSWGLLVSHHAYLPNVIGSPIAWCYERLSIRFPERFFLLMSLPIAYIAAKGWDNFRVRWVALWALGLVLVQMALVWWVLLPVESKILPDTRLAAVVALGCGIGATVFLFLRAFKRVKPQQSAIFSGMALLCIAATFIFGSSQSTHYGVEYVGRPEFAATLPSDRLGWRNYMGLRWNYDQTIQKLEPIFHLPRPHLEGETTLKGRVLSIFNSARRYYFHAPVTGHRFAFSVAQDPAASSRLWQLAKIGSNSILDLYGVCWLIPEENEQNAKTLPRPTCFPDGLIVPGFRPLAGEVEVLNWMKQASRAEFQNTIGFDCKEIPCDSLVPGSLLKGKTNLGKVNWVRQGPGFFDLNVESKQPGFLFLSTLYRFDWKGKVNGIAIKPLRANYAFMAIPVPAGRSSVSLWLDNWVQRWSNIVTFVTLTLLILVCILLKKRYPLPSYTPPGSIGR